MWNSNEVAQYDCCLMVNSIIKIATSISKERPTYLNQPYYFVLESVELTWTKAWQFLLVIHEPAQTVPILNSGCLYQWESRDSSATRIFF